MADKETWLWPFYQKPEKSLASPKPVPLPQETQIEQKPSQMRSRLSGIQYTDITHGLLMEPETKRRGLLTR